MDEHIQELLKEIDRYHEALNNAEAALNDAEKELDEELYRRFSDHPDQN